MLFIKKKGEDVVSSRKKIMITLIIILLLLTAGVYGYGVYYFTEHFLPGSMVNGFNCSYMTVSQSEELLTQKVGAYVLTIDTRNNGQESITAKQAGLSYDSDGSVDKLIRNQDRFTWFLAFNQHRNYEVSSSQLFYRFHVNPDTSAFYAFSCSLQFQCAGFFARLEDNRQHSVKNVHPGQMENIEASGVAIG